MNFDVKKLAYCGIYCYQCSHVVAFETNNREHLLAMPEKMDKYKNLSLSEYGTCPGCKDANLCGDCEIKDCASLKGIDCCSDCGSFPCEIIINFANDGIPHHKWALENLKNIKLNGKVNWFEEFKTSLHCTCGERLSWYYKCSKH